MDRSPEFLTIADVAERLGMSKGSVYELIRTRQLRALIKENEERRTYRIRRVDFDAYLASRVRDSFNDDWE
jgi:excisionase family DNA binding protein